MKIFNETKTIELKKDQCDLTKGYFKEDTLNNGENQEPIYLYVLYNQKQLYMKEADELRYWFENEYKELTQKYTRKIALGIKLRDGSDPNTKLQELYLLAETNANRIHEIDNILKTY